ncbi:hypothetical protein FB451DRAFT_1367760 [Mycena latifolia]|nr:hypothetical protein FB451DRAFT_1367760 [Mycena latifolia]
MQFRLPRTFVVAALVAGALASPHGAVARTDGGQCNTGYFACCSSTQTAQSAIASIPGLGAVLNGVQLGQLVGLGCLLDVTTCVLAPVCCTNTVFSGLINVGCISV